MANNEIKLNNDWSLIKFSDCIIQLNTGLNPRKIFSLGNGKLRYITAKNLTKLGTIDFSDADFIDETAKQIINKRSDIQIGDILLSSRAPIGHCHLIKESPDLYDIGESIFSIRVNDNIVLPEYMALYLSSDYFIKMASKQVTGSIILEIRISDLMNTDIIVPPKCIQKKIAQWANALDGKIQGNEQINNNLEALAQTIYDYWFTQYNFPNEDHKAYYIHGGQMVFNETLKREIPLAWDVEPIIKNTNIYQPQTISNDLFNDEFEFDVYGGGGLIGKYNQYNHADSEVIISCRGNCGNFYFTSPKSWITGNAMVVSPQNKRLSKYYIYCYLNRYGVKQYLSGSVQKQLTRENLSLMNIVVPPQSILDSFDNIVKPIFDKMLSIRVEITHLQKQRDFLLPLLMNGQATIE